MNETIKNLAKAFIGESQARNRYTFYASEAKKAGYEQIAAIFTETADQEKEHAKRLMQMINEIKKTSNENLDLITVEADAPTILDTTLENLKAAAAGEKYEHTEMYPAFADQAEKDGLAVAANVLRSIAEAESHHEERYRKLINNLQEGAVFKRKEKLKWVCRNCGYVHASEEAPEKCPSCNHSRAYFQRKCEEY